MSYLFPYASVGTQLSAQPLVSVQNPQHVLNGKERDNTWLQLPVCPNLTKKPEERTECPPDAKCRANYGHPPRHVLEHLLTSGYIVCCQAYIFATFGSAQTHGRAGCNRGEATCKYYHPPEHLALLVINAGRNNKRLRSEVAAKLKLAVSASPAPASSVTSSNLLSLNTLPSTYTSLTGFSYPQHQQQQQQQLTLSSYQQLQTALLQQQQQSLAGFSSIEPLPPGTQHHLQEDEVLTVTKRKRHISPNRRLDDERSPEAKRRSLNLMPEQQQQQQLQLQQLQQPLPNQHRLAATLQQQQSLQSAYYIPTMAPNLASTLANPPLYFWPAQATSAALTWPYDATTMASYFQSQLQ